LDNASADDRDTVLGSEPKETDLPEYDRLRTDLHDKASLDVGL
jgi:hypothetical protein